MLTHQELATRRKRHCYELKSHEHRCSKAQYGKTRLIYIIVYAFTSVSYHSRKQFYLYSQTLLFVKHTSKISLRCIRISLVRVCIRLLNSRLLHICCLLERVQLPSLSALPWSVSKVTLIMLYHIQTLVHAYETDDIFNIVAKGEIYHKEEFNPLAIMFCNMFVLWDVYIL